MKYRLDVSYDYSCLIYGLLSQAPLHSLCWHINRSLKLDLAFQGIHAITGRGVQRNYAYALYEDELTKAKWYVIENQRDKASLVPELKRFDYIVKVEEYDHIDQKLTHLALRSLEPVLMCHEADIETITGKESLIIE